MRLLILLLMTALAAHGAWSGYFLQTPASSQVVSGPHTNFPVLIDLTDNHLKQIGGGGVVNDAQGDDVAPYSDATCTTLLPFELVAYDGTGGRWRAWVNVSSLSSSSNVYLCAGNSSQTTSLQNVSGTWNSGYGAVYHLGDESTCGTAESTTNALTLTNTGTVSGATGKIYGACGSDFSITKHLTRASNAAIVSSGSWTISAWVNPNSCGAYSQVIFKGQNAKRNYELDIGNSDCKIRANMTQSGVEKTATATTAISTSTWSHIAGRYNGSNVQAFVNGTADGTTSTTGSPDTDTSLLKIGVFENSGNYSVPFPGLIDEVRISTVARSDGWITTEYNTGTPSTFWAATSWTSLSTATLRRRIFIQ